jgi:hypothetical protein
MANEHESSTNKEKRSASEAVHSPKTCCDTHKLRAVDDTRKQKLHLIVLAQRFEERGRVVDERIYT